MSTRRLNRIAWGTKALGGLSVGTVGVLLGAETVRVWRLGKMPVIYGEDDTDGRIPLRRVPAVLYEGYKVSSTRENAILNMVASFVTTFAITRGITHAIRARGGLGPIRNLVAGGRHIHHLVPGTVLSLLSGGSAISLSRDSRNRWLAIPFGIGSALVLDEAALLLSLDDVYWSEEGKLSVQIAFATMGLLGAIGYAIQVHRRGEPGTEFDWRAAAKAFQDLQLTPGSTSRSLLGVDR
ncbi:hypothetical protein [Desertimonas flava]|uniref:hypothetical protein n=1 Tax=Desertimonas flava TaxID=2064846 RepID=UPI0013C489E9|nr:hypothetical protein [Desertimonas flava]